MARLHLEAGYRPVDFCVMHGHVREFAVPAREDERMDSIALLGFVLKGSSD